MAIEFCNKCNSILKITTQNNKQYYTCPRCNTTKECNTKGLILNTRITPESKPGKGISQKDLSGQDFKCKKCKNNKCKIIDLGMMFGDEDWIYLLKCTKCGHSERIGDWC